MRGNIWLLSFHGLPSRMKKHVRKAKPWHLQAAAYLAQGKSQTDVAKELGHTRQAISVLWAQPWFKQLVADTMIKAAEPALRESLTAPRTPRGVC